MKALKIIGIVVGALVVLVFIFAKANRISPLSWGHDEVNQPMFSDQAINGYDAVAYIEQNKAIAGSENYTHEWRGAQWSFATQENRDLFISNPEKYAPQYGGYCAFAVSKGFTANPDPNTFEILDDKVYLFADEDVKSEWLNDKASNLELGNNNW